MAVAYFPLIAGVMVAPIIGSYLSQAAGWRWVFWLSAIAGGVCEILFVLFFRESYKVKILTKRVSRIKGDEEVAKNGLTSTSTETHRKARIDAFQRAIVQPAKLALFTPIVPLLAIYNGLNYGYSYLILTTMTQLFETTYGIKEGPIGLMFLGKGMIPKPKWRLPLRNKLKTFANRLQTCRHGWDFCPDLSGTLGQVHD